MGTPPPVAIGTKGTVGSLVRKEIEYFTMFELERRGCRSLKQPRTTQVVDKLSGRGYSSSFSFSSSSSSSCSRSSSSLWVLLMTWKRKKRRFSNGFLPRICSVSEVAETNHLDRIPGFSYRILNDDFNNFGDSKDCL